VFAVRAPRRRTGSGLGSKLLAQPFLLLAQLRVLHIGVCSISFSILIFSRMLYYVRMLLVIRIR
jgi:hypothetical protein